MDEIWDPVIAFVIASSDGPTTYNSITFSTIILTI